MDQYDEVQIIQEIASRVISVPEPGWSELMISYHVGEDVSDFCSSYLIEEREAIKEKGIPFNVDVEGLLRKLRGCIALGGKQEFTSCKLHFWSDGKFESTYGYDEVDWDGLIYLGSNFFPGSKNSKI